MYAILCTLLTLKVCRGKTGVPPIGRFTHRSTASGKETSITLQDGCFGVATLMRIAALFIPSTEPQEDSLIQSESSPGRVPPPVLPSNAVNVSHAENTGSAPACELSEAENLLGQELKSRDDGSEVKQQNQIGNSAGHPVASKDTVKSSNISAEPKDSQTPELQKGLDSQVQSTESSEQLGEDWEEIQKDSSQDQQSNTAAQAAAKESALPDDETSSKSSPLADKAKESLLPEPQALQEEVHAANIIDSSAPISEDGTAFGHESRVDERQPVDKADQVSIEIIRCRAVCPDWQDTALDDPSFGAKPDTLVLAIPYLLLQLPPSNPALHPSSHPVQVGPSSTPK